MTRTAIVAVPTNRDQGTLYVCARVDLYSNPESIRQEILKKCPVSGPVSRECGHVDSNPYPANGMINLGTVPNS